MPKYLRLLVILLPIFTACSDIAVKTDPVSNIFNRFSGYAWFDVERELNSDLEKSAHQEVVAAVEQTLANKRYEKVAPGEADFYINYHLSAEKVLDVEKTEVYAGYGPGFVLRRGEGVRNETYVQGKEVNVQYYRKGTLILDIVDARTNQLIWRGEADKQLEKRLTKDQRVKTINSAVNKLLGSIPARVN